MRPSSGGPDAPGCIASSLRHTFSRHHIPTDMPADKDTGYVVPASTFAPGERIVVQAGQLLCRKNSAHRSRSKATTTDGEPRARPDAHGGFQAAVIRFAVRFRGTVVALAFLLLGYGTVSVINAKYDVFPEFAPPQVGIQAEAPGLTAGAGRGAGHPTHRECRQRRTRRRIAAFVIDPGPVRHHRHLPGPNSDIYRNRQVSRNAWRKRPSSYRRTFPRRPLPRSRRHPVPCWCSDSPRRRAR